MNSSIDPEGKRLQEFFVSIHREYACLSPEQQAKLEAWLQSAPDDIGVSGSKYGPSPVEPFEYSEAHPQFALPGENPNPVLRLGGDGQVLYANLAAQDLIRHWDCPDRGTAADFWQAVARMAGQGGLRRVVELDCHGRSYSFDVISISPAGYINLYGRDETGRKQVENEYRQSQQRLTDLLTSIQDGFFELDREWRFTYVNERAASNSGYSPQELVGANIWEKLPFIAGSKFETLYRQVMATRQPQRKELQSLVREVWFSLTISPSASGITVFWQDITERKKARQALEESEQKYRTLFDAMSEGFVLCAMVWDAQGQPLDMTILEANPVLERQIGLPRAHVLQRRVGEILPIVEPVWYQRFGEVVRSGKPDHFEEYSRALDRWFEVYAYAIQHDDQIVITFRDVSERKLTELEIQAAHQRLAEILGSIQDVFYSLDRDWRFTYVNAQAEEVWGKSREDLLGRRLWEVFSEAQDSDSFRQLQRAMQDRVAIHYETRSPVLHTWIDVRAYPTAEGGLTVDFRDISDRKRAEEALRRSEERFNQAFNASPLGLAISRKADGRIQTVNDRFSQIFGYSPAELVGKTSTELHLTAHPSDRKKVAKQVEKQGILRDLEIEIRTKDGQIRPASISVVTLNMEGIEYFLSLVQDITERKQLEAETRQQAAQTEIQRRLIEQREQERTQIARDLHDGPIQELTGAALTLQGIILDNRDLGVTRQLGELASSLQTQIGELRAYAQELRPPALAKFGLEQAIRSHMDLFEEKHPELSITFEGHQQGELTSVPLRMAYYRIYQEALNNILKHTHANQVTIRFEKDEHEVVLEIHDNGQGFKPPGDWLSLARGGHLGLVGMRERAEAVGGTLEVRSEPGQGTTVRVKVRLNPG